MDLFDARTNLNEGDQVKVITPSGCPPPNHMGHCFVGDPQTGKFIGLVSTASLQKEKMNAEV